MLDFKNIREHILGIKTIEKVSEPLFFTTHHSADVKIVESLIRENLVFSVHNEILSQLGELMVIRNPERKIDSIEKEKLVKDYLEGTELDNYGVWIYYPWSKRLVHTLNENEFIELRTSRNRNKITKEEQNILKNKSVGIIGLSVGQSIALTIALERVCGEIRLADFDSVELSNMNRIRTGLHNIGMNKAIIAAREIKEIDPFIGVKIFSDGITEKNIDGFFDDGKRIDLLIEVCDEIQVKIDSRLKAKNIKVPVVMDTNDRGMVDVERFDLEENREIFHGYLSAFSESNYVVTKENRMGILNAILSYDTLSDRMKISMKEIGKTITTWPQLASSVVLGGAVTADVTRRILLGHFNKSGRYYIDFDTIFSDND